MNGKLKFIEVLPTCWFKFLKVHIAVKSTSQVCFCNTESSKRAIFKLYGSRNKVSSRRDANAFPPTFNFTPCRKKNGKRSSCQRFIIVSLLFALFFFLSWPLLRLNCCGSQCAPGATVSTTASTLCVLFRKVKSQTLVIFSHGMTFPDSFYYCRRIF